MPASASPTISIYQNPDHVAGILQQIHLAPLGTSESREQGSQRTDTERKDRSGQADVKASANVPGIGSIGGGVGGSRGRAAESGTGASSRVTQNFEYSQAYYLTVVRDALRERAVLKTVSGVSDAEGLDSGDFVEYQATFRPNEINALLDILTPDLIAAITHYYFRSEGIKKFAAWDRFEEMRIFSEKNLAEAQAKADLARAVAEAVRVDFRSEKTREFYGTIGTGEEAVTAITICDNPHFVVDDKDRILDGNYTVLGKVTSPMVRDVPILERNKVLDRLRPAMVDDAFKELRGGANKQARKLEDRLSSEPEIGDVFDTALASRIEGPSFQVVPVAIYA